MYQQRVTIPNWSPTTVQRELFQEWRTYVISHLVSCKSGLKPSKIPGRLNEELGERMPLFQLGLPNVYHFMYHMADDIEVREVDGELYVFIRESSVPEEMDHIRVMVLGQRKDKKDYPMRKHGMYTPCTELLRYVPPQRAPLQNHYFNNNARPAPYVPGSQQQRTYQRPFSNGQRGSGPRRGGGGGSYQPRQGGFNRNSVRVNTLARNAFSDVAPSSVGNASRSLVAPARRVPGLANLEINDDDWGTVSNPVPSSRPPPPRKTTGGPVRRRYLPELISDESEDSMDSDHFDFYSGVSSMRPKKDEYLPPPVISQKTADWSMPSSENIKPTVPVPQSSSQVSSSSRPSNLLSSNACTIGSISASASVQQPSSSCSYGSQTSKAIISEDVVDLRSTPAVKPSVASNTKRGIPTSPSKPETKLLHYDASILTTSIKQYKLDPNGRKTSDDFLKYGYSVDINTGLNSTKTLGLSSLKSSDTPSFRMLTFKQDIQFPKFIRGGAVKSFKQFMEQNGIDIFSN